MTKAAHAHQPNRRTRRQRRAKERDEVNATRTSGERSLLSELHQAEYRARTGRAAGRA